MTRSNWLVSARFDLAFFVAPAVVSIVLLWVSPESLFERDDLAPWAWFLLIPVIDVSHVYASLFRTYFDVNELRRRPALYSAAPALAFVGSTVAYATDPRLFWRLLAYTAVWHFVRQQYGFLVLYRRRAAERDRLEARFDSAILHLSMLYPLVYWHAHLPRRFAWFVDGDFVPLPEPGVASALGWIYAAAAIAYLGKEGLKIASGVRVSLGKNLLIFATAASWYVGIVAYDSDYSFTVTNVVTHGVPYVALVWIYSRRKSSTAARPSWLATISEPRHVAAFVGLLLALALVEEGLWDRLVWADHPGIFGGRNHALFASDSPLTAFVVALLAAPQLTHYVLDGFIWRTKRNPDVARLLLAIEPPAGETAQIRPRTAAAY